MDSSIEFYKKLGFEVANYYPQDRRSELSWVWLQAGGANLMLVEASEKVIPSQQAVIFYLYAEDVAALRDETIAAGIDAGYVVMIAQRQ
jgi:hypothetical protein